MKAEQTEFLPSRNIKVANQAAVEIGIVQVVLRNTDLRIRARDEVHMLAGRQFHLELFDERSHVAVADNLALPLFDAKHRLRHLDGHIALNFGLAAQTPVVFNLLAGEVALFRVENLAAAFQNLAFALSARALATASRRQIDALVGQCRQQARARFNLNFLVAIDGDFHLARNDKVAFSHQQDGHKQKDDDKKHTDACQY